MIPLKSGLTVVLSVGGEEDVTSVVDPVVELWEVVVLVKGVDVDFVKFLLLRVVVTGNLTGFDVVVRAVVGCGDVAAAGLDGGANDVSPLFGLSSADASSNIQRK